MHRLTIRRGAVLERILFGFEDAHHPRARLRRSGIQSTQRLLHGLGTLQEHLRFAKRTAEILCQLGRRSAVTIPVLSPTMILPMMHFNIETVSRRSLFYNCDPSTTTMTMSKG